MKGLYRIEGAVNLLVELFFCFSAGLSPKDKMRIRTGKRVPYDTEGQMEVNKKSGVYKCRSYFLTASFPY